MLGENPEKGLSHLAAILAVPPGSRERNGWAELRNPLIQLEEPGCLGWSLIASPPPTEPTQALSRIPGQLPLPAGQVLRRGPGHGRQGGAVRPSCGLSEVVAHVESTGRARAGAACRPGLCPCPVGVGSSSSSLPWVPSLLPFPVLSSFSESLFFFYLCLSCSTCDFSLVFEGTWWRK